MVIKVGGGGGYEVMHIGRCPHDIMFVWKIFFH